ncbi:MAG TPA: hypothetical protein VFI73_04975 [Candidatus Nitrosopolaris sp.]|nr:hypothetical protein [Candidatus Nitrosopolaris sp.]
MTDRQSSITNVILKNTHPANKTKKGDPVTLDLSFKIDGNIREVFNPKMWERAYDNHDNVFRISVSVALKENRKKILLTKISRKAPMFWTRSPKIPFRIWVSIIRDDTPFYPSTIEEAKSLLFDVNKTFKLETNNLDHGNHKISAEIKVSWGRHYYTNPEEISIVSKTIDLHIED